ncbi:MAG: hypothetical protein WDA06_00495 [Phenylobacterium sp.]
MSNLKEIFDLISKDSVQPLENECDIEKILSIIDSIDSKLEFFKKLKKNRIESIANEVSKLENNKAKLQEVIKSTLIAIEQKSLTFPGVGKVGLRKVKGKWDILNEDDLLSFLKEELPKDDYERVVEHKPIIKKTELNNILTELQKRGKVPGCVKREDDRDSLSVSFEDGFKNDVEIDNDNDITVKNTEDNKAITEQGFDALEI